MLPVLLPGFAAFWDAFWMQLPENATIRRDFRITGNRLETRGTNAAGVTGIIRYRRVE